MNQMTSFARQRAALAVALTLLVPALAEAQTKVKTGFNMFSPQQDVEIGAQSAAQVEQQLPVLNDSSVNSYVNSIGERLAVHAPGPKFDYRFKVINASDLNAFALPGGYLYINRGAIEAAKSDGEIAGVLAHEIAHSALRHGTANASKAYATQTGLSILGGLLGGKVGAGTAQIINAVGGFGMNAIFLKYSRDAERQADTIGVQMMVKAGYNPADMVSFFQTLQGTDKKKTANWLSSHPQTNDRIKAIQKEASLLNVPLQKGTRTTQLANAQSRLRSMSPARRSDELAKMAAAGQRPTNGTSSSRTRPAQGVAAPSAQMRTYTNKGQIFQVQYPSNWEVIGESQGAVTFAPPGGAGNVNGNAEVVYGAIISHFDPRGARSNLGLGLYEDNNSSTSLTEGTQVLLQGIQQSSPHLQIIRASEQRVTVAGGQGLAVALRGKSPTTGINERVTVVTRQLSDGHLVYMLFINPDKETAAYKNAFSSMVASLRIDRSH